MYDTSQSGRELSKYCGVSLAWWHSYKWATKKILEIFACDIFGPLFHHLFPIRKFTPGSSSLSSNTMLISLVRLAYPSFKDQLYELIDKPTLTHTQRILLQNVKDLCEFFIPVVI